MKNLKTLFATLILVLTLGFTSFGQTTYPLILSGENPYSNSYSNSFSLVVVDTSFNQLSSLNVNQGDILLLSNGITTTGIITVTITPVSGTTTFTIGSSPYSYTVGSSSFSISASYLYTFPINGITYTFTSSNPFPINVTPTSTGTLTTGINNTTVDKVQFTAFPNPVVDVLNIKAPIDLGTVNVFSLTGQVVFTDVVKDTETSIDFTNFSPGTYIVRVGNSTKTIIKQ